MMRQEAQCCQSFDFLLSIYYPNRTMNLKNFELHIDGRILERGLEYYSSGQVETLEYDGTMWTAEVSGSDDYQVRVTLSDTGDIVESDCDCPYDFGPICKHQVAVFYALQNKPLQKIKKEARKQQETLDELVKGLDQSTLAAFILDYASRNKRFRDDVLIRFSKTPDVLGYARRLIKASVKNVMYQGFVEYSDTGRAVEGAYAVLEMVEEQEDVFTAVNLCFVILDEMVKLEQSCDDSHGEVGEVIERALMVLTDSVAAIPHDFSEHEKLMDLLLHHTTEAVYNDWDDRRLSVYRAAVPLCAVSGARKKLEKQLTALQKPENSSFSDRYTTGESQNIQYRIILRFDGSARADDYIEQHLSNSDFRKMAIEKAISESAFERALALCFEGEKRDEEYAGLVSDWKNYRYTVYENQNNSDGQKELAAQFILDGDFDYFLKLRALYQSTEWQPILEDLLRKMESGKGGYKNYVQILIHEHLQERILNYCRKTHSEIKKLYPHLLPEYRDDVDALFLQYIRYCAKVASSRGAYRAVCEIIREYKKACGSTRADSIIAELREQHPRQPAFLDELKRSTQCNGHLEKLV